jgi:hypothetical protein
MTATTAAPGQLNFDPDYYLDCRQPEWEIYEDRGLVRFERELGSKTPLVFVDDDCVEVLEALRARVAGWTRAKR